MQFILENYLLFVLIGLFFVFALIGYLVDMLRKGNDEKKNTANDNISSINIAKLDDIKEEPENNSKIDKSDELLKNYDNDESEVITNKKM